MLITEACSSCDASSFSILAAKSRLAATISRNFTNARTTRMLISTARWLRRTAESIATPCSVKAYGNFRRPPQLDLANCNIKSCEFLFGQLEHEILRKPLRIAPDRQIQISGGYPIQPRQVRIEHNFNPTNKIDAPFDHLLGHTSQLGGLEHDVVIVFVR
jgi:hypothetical protein